MTDRTPKNDFNMLIRETGDKSSQELTSNQLS
jgi:hypothetical protein